MQFEQSLDYRFVAGMLTRRHASEPTYAQAGKEMCRDDSDAQRLYDNRPLERQAHSKAENDHFHFNLAKK